LPSNNAFSNIKRAGKNPEKFAKINLMFEDEYNSCDTPFSRKFVSYIGTIAEDHAFDEFVRFVVNSVERNELPDLQFLIATRSQIPESFQNAVSYCIKQNRLIVKSEKPLSNKEINHYYASSLVVWNAYKRSMQSGVMPKAYMFGTPVVVSDRNQSEFFIDRRTGIMISSVYDFDEILKAVNIISKNFDDYTVNCRSMFLEKFHYKALAKSFMDFVTQ
jgi:glycosyltransferase involved in cell wall biosynthesis